MIVSRVRVRHAAPSVLPNAPREPVIREGSVVHGRLTHELIESAQGWQFRPNPDLWRGDKGFLLGFGIPFSVLSPGLLSWILHTYIANWPLSIFFAVGAVTVCFVPVLVLAGMWMRACYRRLCCLSIPHDADNLELDSPEEPDRHNPDLIAGLKRSCDGATRTVRLLIPVERVIAVQLCPWKHVVGGSGGKEITDAVQGALVLAPQADGVDCRLPILLTMDYVGAARLMQKLANILNVPYLFGADAEGWKAEETRSRSRRALCAGGSTG